MNARNFMKLMNKNPQVETVTVVGAAMFTLVGAALLFPLFLIWIATIALLVKFNKQGASDEQRTE